MRHLSIAYLSGTLLVTLLTGSLQAQRIFPTERDSLLAELQASKPDTNLVKIWIRLGEYQVYEPGEFQADMDSARTYAQQALTLSQRLGYYAGEGKSLNVLGTISRESKEYDRAITYQQAAINHFKKYNDSNGEAQSYLFLAQVLRDKGDKQTARNEIQKAIAIYSGSPMQLAEAYMELGTTYANWGEELNDKIKNYEQALQLFTQAGNKLRQADVHKDLGDLLQVQGTNAQALIQLRKSLALYNSINYPQLQGIYGLLGAVFSNMGDHQEAIKYSLLAVKTAEALKDSSLVLCTIYNRVGLTYYWMNQFQKAQVYFKKSLTVAQRYQDSRSITFVMRNLFSVSNKLNQHEHALQLLQSMADRYPPSNFEDSIGLSSLFLRHYIAVKKYALAQEHCDQLLLILDRMRANKSDDHGNKLRPVIQFFLASKQHQNARKYLAVYEAYCERTSDLEGASITQLLWFQLDSTQANYLSAIKHYQLHKQLEDSLFNETKSRQIATLEILYETEEKEKDLQLKDQSIDALNKERQLQAVSLDQASLTKNVTIGGIIAVLIIATLLYRQSRLRKKNNIVVTNKNEQLQHLLTEKEWLLKEIHHRVKNNLQTVMSLLNSQSAYIDNDAALTAIHDSQYRVHAMSLIHQKLYNTENASSIEISSYIRELASYLRDSFNTGHRIRFEFDTVPLKLDVSQAVPVGLILNEAITNSIKYAFPNDRAGIINISLSSTSPKHYLLSISDNGVGMPAQPVAKRTGSLGMSLMAGLAEDLDGTFVIENDNGTRIRISFVHDLNIKRHSIDLPLLPVTNF